MQVKAKVSCPVLPSLSADGELIDDRNHLYGELPAVVLNAPLRLHPVELLVTLFDVGGVTFDELAEMSDDEVRSHAAWAVATYGIVDVQRRADECRAAQARYDTETRSFLMACAARVSIAFGIEVPSRFGPGATGRGYAARTVTSGAGLATVAA